MTDISNRNRGICGNQYDRYVERYDDSTLSRMQQQYWEAKQTFLRKLKRKEDDCIVASDAELDAKLELFRSIEESCQNLICVLEGYQDHVCGLAHEESSTGRFLKECGKLDKTRAGKMMIASGKTLCYTAQQRIQLRNPLVRLYQEVETFQYRAVVDTLMTIDKMEKGRTAYRAALLWMKDASQQLDPDTYKQLEKFRKVQSHVRRTKSRFDKLKLDTLQKVDLLSASRCNMYSHALAGYQTALLQFWEKTSRTMNAVAESFKGYQYYEFNMLPELTETSKKLAEESGVSDDIRKIFDDTEDDDDKDRLIFFDSEYRDEEIKKKDSKKGKNATRKPNSSQNKTKTNDPNPIEKGIEALDFNSLLDLSCSENNDPPVGTSVNEVQSNQLPSKSTANRDILTANDLEVDDLTLLNDILNAPTTPVIEANQLHSSALPGDLFMPSQLINWNQPFSNFNLNPMPNSASNLKTTQEVKSNEKKPSSEKRMSKKQDMSPWLNLFADLDPLSNPDAVGKKSDEPDDRNC